MAKYYRANNKRGYLNARITSFDSQLELQVIDYGGGAKDRNIPTISGKLMRLVIWGIQYPNPSADPNKEIVSAEWSGSGQVFDIVRAQEGTEATEHYIGDNIALLFTAGMSREILVFEDFENSKFGSIAYSEDVDVDGEMEVLNLPPDNEVSEEGYRKVLTSDREGEHPYWEFVWEPEVGAVKAGYSTRDYIVCGGTVDNSYLAWLLNEKGNIHRNLLSGFGTISYASVVCPNCKFYVNNAHHVWKFNKDGTVDTGFGTNGEMAFGSVSVLDLALDLYQNLYVVNTRPAVATPGDTVWKVDSVGNILWSTYSLTYGRASSGVVVGSDGYVYVACSTSTGSGKRGMKLNPASGVLIRYYTALGARKVAVDDFGFVYFAGDITGYNLIRRSNDGVSSWSRLLGNSTLTDVFVVSGATAGDTKVYVTGRDTTNNISVWKLNYNLSVVEATYTGYYSYGLDRNTAGNLLVACHPTIAGEDGVYQIVELKTTDLSFIQGIKFNNSGLKHVSHQIVSPID